MTKVIYAADDEQDILDIMNDFLCNAGYEVHTFLTGDALFDEFKKKPCDLVLLDIMMPGSDGLTICKNIRQISNVPIIILTAKESEAYHMKGFMLGTDDYLIKPFSPSLLVMHVKALLRRAEMKEMKEKDIQYGDIIYSSSTHEVLCNGKNIGLTMTEFSLLGCLLENKGNALSRDELLNKVWGIDNEDIETRVTDETIRRIRKKLKVAGSHVKISAIWGYGYKLEIDHEN